MSSSRIEPSDAFILFADLQEGIADLPLTLSLERLKKGVLHLARLAKLLDIPAIVTGVPNAEGNPKVLAEIGLGLGSLPTFIRTTADALRNPEILSAVASSGRKTLLISGVATELAVQLPALTGIDLGYRTFVVIDACAGISERTERAALDRIISHGGSTTCVMTLAGELGGDFREPQGQEAVRLLFSMATPVS